MNKIPDEDFKRARKKGEDPRLIERLCAVNSVIELDGDIQTAAKIVRRCPNSIRDWVIRYEEDGLEGLLDLSRSGRPPKIPWKKMKKIIKSMSAIEGLTPARLQQYILERIKTGLHITTVRKILHAHYKSPKSTTLVHINRTGMGDVLEWQRHIKRVISRMEYLGFTVFVIDASFFSHDVMRGRKLWGDVGERIYAPYTGSHKKIVVYGGITNGGDRLFRTYDHANAHTFVQFLTEMHRAFGKILIIADKAAPHTSVLVKKFVGENKEIRIEYFPTGTPQLNAIEEVWNKAKRNLAVSEYYPTFEDMKHTISEYFRTTAIRLGVYKYLYRRLEYMLKDF